jgi:hypothetical protein
MVQMNDNRGYSFPDPIDPGDSICFKVYVPKDTLYVAAFWRAYQYFGQWVAWRKDDAHTAKDVAAVWLPLIERSRTEFLAGGGCLPEFRLNPDTCLLEVQCNDDWQPVFTTEHPQGGAPRIYPPGTTEYDNNTARCIAAANITAQLMYAVNKLVAEWATIAEGVTATLVILALLVFFAPPFALLLIGIFIFGLAEAFTIEEAEAGRDAIVWTDFRDQLACFIERDGTVTETDRQAIMTYMETLYSGNPAWNIAKIIVQHTTADGLTLDGQIPQNDIAIDDCVPCAWIADVPLDLTGGIFTIQDECSQPDGHFQSGVGILSDDGYTGGGCSTPKNRLVARWEWSSHTQLSRVVAYRVPDSPSDGYEQFTGYIIGDDHNIYLVWNVADGAGTPIDVTMAPGTAGIGWHMSVDHHDGVLGCDAGYSRIKFYGTGTIPTELLPYIL